MNVTHGSIKEERFKPAYQNNSRDQIQNLLIGIVFPYLMLSDLY